MDDAPIRSGGSGPALTDTQEGERVALGREPDFTVGRLHFRPSTRQLVADGRTETLEPRVMQVLALLARRRGEVVPRDELVEGCWEGRAVSEDAINRSIAKARRVAEAHGGFEIETIPRVGYRLAEHDAKPAPARRALRWWHAAAALTALAIAAALWLTLLRPGPAETGPTTLAVLPFRNLSPGDNYFAEGVAEEILTQLARQPGLRVAGRSSSWLFRDNADPRDIGRRLDVAYVLEGSVRRAGGQVRVDVALVDTRDGMRRWSQNFAGSLDDIFAIQAQIGNAVAGNLSRQIVLSAPESGPLTTSGEAYTLYVTARGLMRERTPAKLETAVTLLRRLVELDPDYAPGWSALGSALHLFEFYGGDRATQPTEAEQVRLVDRALRLAPDLAEAHAAYALIRDLHPSTRRHVERAAQLDPSDSQIWYWLYNVRRADLDFEGALEAVRRSAAIDPFFALIQWYPDLAFSMGEREEAERFWRMTASRHPDPYQRQAARATMAMSRNDLSQAYRQAQQASRLASPDASDNATRREAAILLRLDVERALGMVDPPRLFQEMVRGRTPTMAEVRAAVPRLADFWSLDEIRIMLPRFLLNAGRGRDLLALYDSAFRSPDDMAARHPLGREMFIEDVPNVALALREAGRNAEAERLLALAGGMIERTRRRGRTPLEFRANEAAVRAVQGRRGDALAALQDVIAGGWRWQSTSAFFPLAQQPAFRSLRDPRIARWDAMMQAELARERRELAAGR